MLPKNLEYHVQIPKTWYKDVDWWTHLIVGDGLTLEKKPDGPKLSVDLRNLQNLIDGGGGGGSDTHLDFYKDEDKGAFRLVYNSDGTASAMTACYYQIGGFTYFMGDQSVTWGCVMALVVSSDSAGSVSASVTAYADFAAVQSAQQDLTKIIIPLWLIGTDGKPVTDFRNMPNVGIIESYGAGASS